MVEAAIGGAAALGGAIYGAVASAKYNKQARALIQQERDENKRWWEVNNAKDYTQRSDFMNIFTKQREMLTEQFKMARARNTVAGGTDEALAMQKAAATGAMAQTISDTAAAASSLKDSQEQMYRQKDSALNQQQVAGLQQQGQQAAQAGAQLVNAGMNLVGVGLQKKQA